MIFTNAILQIDIAEEFARPHIAAAHASLQKPIKRVNHGETLKASFFFNSLLESVSLKLNRLGIPFLLRL